MTKKARLSELNRELSKPEKKTTVKKGIEANIPRGERANFLKLTITMPAEMLGALKEIGIKKKAAREKDTDTSALIRQAVAEFLKKNE